MIIRAWRMKHCVYCITNTTNAQGPGPVGLGLFGSAGAPQQETYPGDFEELGSH